ncbi:MAG TPA: AAA family ATPase, partial [Ktedonobacteraceae bacterium]|nr:AAA family ATPase [Ktedonobacteraceae bacterium]
GRAFEVGGRLPYQPLIDAIRPRLDQENAPEDLLADVWLAELSRLLPELRERYPDLPFPTQEETRARPQLFEAMARLLQAWATSRPLLLWIDDVQWADTASLDLLLFILEHSSQRRIPILLIMSLRTEEIRPGTVLGTWRHALTRSESVSRLPLSALSQQATTQLLEAIQSAAEAQAEPGESLEQVGDWFYRQTRGVPFYLLETLKGLLEQRVIQVQSGLNFRGLLAHIERGDIQVSTAIREVIRGRLEQFGPTSRAVLAAAAVLDQQSSFPALIAVTGLNEIEALTAIDEVMYSRVLVESKQGHGPAPDSRYVFAHDLLREVVYQEAGEARKRVLHRRAFEQLQTYALPAAECARHARAAGLGEEEFHWSVRAGDEALTVYAVHDAIALYEQAQMMLANTANADGQTFQERCSLEQLEHLYLHLGRAYALQNDWERTRAAYETLRAIAHKRHNLLVEVRALNHLAVLAGLQASDFLTGKTRLHEALLLARETGDLRVQAETEWNLAQMMMMQWEPKEALQHGQQAIEIARAHDWTELLGRCLFVLSQTYAVGGNWELTLPLAQEGATFYETQNDRGREATEVSAQVIFAGISPTQQMTNRAMEVACLCVVAITQVCLGNPQAGADAARKAVAISRASLNKWAEAFSLLQLNHALLDMAAYEEAFQVAQQALAITRVLQQPLLHFYMLTINGTSLNALGQYEQAYEFLREADELIQQLHAPSWRVISLTRLCMNRALIDDWEAACNYAQETMQIRNELRSQLIFIDFYRYYEIKALLRVGKNEWAAQDIAHLGTLVGTNRRYTLLLLRMQAILAQANGQCDEAIAALAAACRLAEEISLPGEQWQILATLAELYDHTGQQGQAQQMRTRATQIIQHLAEQITDDRLRASFLAMTRLKRWSILSQQFL